MLASILSSLVLATSALAAPLGVSSTFSTLVTRQENNSNSFNITYQSLSGSKYDSLPRLLIVATGGTIAGQSASETNSTAYTPGVVKMSTLDDAVPELLKTAQIDGIQFSNIGSESLTDDIALGLSKLSNKALCAQDSQYNAVLICSHGVTAVAPASWNCGTLIVLNDQICSAYYCQKNKQNTVDTFTAPEFGFLGHLLSIEPVYHYPASQPLAKKTFDISSVEKLPPCEIFYGYQGSDWHLANASIASGAKGLIIAGTGAGSMTDAGKPYIDAIISQGIPVIRSSKIGNGFVVPQGNSSQLIASGSLTPVKARRMLQVLLALNKTNEEIRAAFEEPPATQLSQF